MPQRVYQICHDQDAGCPARDDKIVPERID
jgi:hypothetical protein